MWCNYHTHSEYCDGKGKLQEYAAAARTLGMHALGFSSHAPFDPACEWCMQAGDFDRYTHEIQDLRTTFPVQPELYIGLEVDYIPHVISVKNFAGLDFTVGAIHFVEKLDNGSFWEIDGSADRFKAGLQEIFDGNIKAAVNRYFELTREMVKTAPPSIVGHLDKIKMQNSAYPYFSEQENWYRTMVIDTLDAIKSAGIFIEVNTRGIYKKKTATTYPSPWVLEQILAKQIPIILNSDAHRPEELVMEFAASADLLLSIGFKELNILYEGKWRTCAFSADGIKLS